MSSDTLAPLNCLCLASYDSGFKWGRALAAEIEARGGTLDFGFISTERVTSPGESLRQICGSEVKNSGSAHHAGHELANGPYNVIFLLIDGPNTEAFLNAFHAGNTSTTRPLVICAYAGVVIENIAGGIYARAGADLILANSIHDERLFKTLIRQLGGGDAGIIHTGLPFLPNDLDAKLKSISDEPPKTIVFAAQPSLPGSAADRLYLLSRLFRYCEKYPDRRLVYKPRQRAGMFTFNSDKYPIERALPDLERTHTRPPNFEVSHEPIADLFGEADLCLTLSSTAAIEALGYGVNFNTLTDFGFNQEVMGASLFLGSGRAITLRDFENDKLGSLSASWLTEHVRAPAPPTKTIIDALETHLKGQIRPSIDREAIVRTQASHRNNLRQLSKRSINFRWIDSLDLALIPNLSRGPIRDRIRLLVANALLLGFRIPILSSILGTLRVGILVCQIAASRD